MSDNTDLVQTQTAKRSLLVSMASKYGLEPATFQAVIKATVMPSNASNEQLAAFLMVANTYDLNPVTKEIYAFPGQGGGVTHVVGVDGWITLANRHPQYDGLEFEYIEDEKGAPIACTCTVYRKDRGHPTRVTEYMAECARGTQPWKSHPRRMLRNKALIQGIRYAMGFAGIHDEDDAEVIRGDYKVVSSADTLRTIQHREKAPESPQEASETEKDSKVVAWDARVHSAGKVRNADGSWRRRKGVDPVQVAKTEDSQFKPVEDLVLTEPADDSMLSPEPPTFQDAMEWIETAQDQEALDLAMDAARDLDLTDDERADLAYAYEAQESTISRMQP